MRPYREFERQRRQHERLESESGNLSRRGRVIGLLIVLAVVIVVAILLIALLLH